MKRALVVAALLVFVAPRFSLAQTKLFEGTWNANIARSSYVPGARLKRETLTFEPIGDRFKVSLDGENGQGPYHSEATGKFDGVEVPVLATPGTKRQVLLCLQSHRRSHLGHRHPGEWRTTAGDAQRRV